MFHDAHGISPVCQFFCQDSQPEVRLLLVHDDAAIPVEWTGDDAIFGCG